MKKILEIIKEKKSKLDMLGRVSSVVQKNLDEWYNIELSYTSNAIEGNTLSRVETSVVMDEGLTVEGKSVREHLEVINHGKAWRYVKELVGKRDEVIQEEEILEIHRLVLSGVDDQFAGKYREGIVRIAGSRVVMPNPMKVPSLMNELVSWLVSVRDDVVQIAVEAHYKLVSIHPFVDGNGRTARLFMNLILQKAGYPPVIVKKEDRLRYLEGLEIAQLGGSKDKYNKFMYGVVENSLDVYMEMLQPSKKSKNKDLMKIGELAKMTNETVPTIRHWTKEGLLMSKEKSVGGYQLYGDEMVGRVKEIRRLQKENRKRLDEIRKMF